MADQSQNFKAMAQRIDHSLQFSAFGGAAVIVPPDPNGIVQPIELLMLDAHGDPAQFLSTIVTRIQIMLREIEDRARMQQGFGR